MLLRLLGLLALLGSIALGVAMRVPADEPALTYPVLLISAGAAATALLRFLRPASRLLGSVTFVLVASQVVIPVSHEWVPAWAAAAGVALSLHLFFDQAQARAPVTSDARYHSPLRRMIVAAPLLACLAAIVLAPRYYARIFPERIAAAYELQTVVRPLIALVFVALLIVCLGLLRQAAFRPRPAPAPDEPRLQGTDLMGTGEGA